MKEAEFMEKMDGRTLRRANGAMKDQKFFSEQINTLIANRKGASSAACRVLMAIAGKNPEMLWEYWNIFEGLLYSEGFDSKFHAIYLISALAGADNRGRIEKILPRFGELLENESVATASHAALRLGTIARAKPGLRNAITDMLMNVKGKKREESRNALINGYALDAFERYAEFMEKREMKRIIEFAKSQIKCKSATTQQKARQFLGKYGR